MPTPASASHQSQKRPTNIRKRQLLNLSQSTGDSGVVRNKKRRTVIDIDSDIEDLYLKDEAVSDVHQFLDFHAKCLLQPKRCHSPTASDFVPSTPPEDPEAFSEESDTEVTWRTRSKQILRMDSPSSSDIDDELVVEELLFATAPRANDSVPQSTLCFKFSVSLLMFYQVQSYTL
jgi:hypothetical protein